MYLADTPIYLFSQSDLAANSVMYKHSSHLEVYTDSFTFVVSDGTNEVSVCVCSQDTGPNVGNCLFYIQKKLI